MDMIYNNPNETWMQPDPLKGLSDEERIGAGCLQLLIYFAVAILALGICSLFTSCKTTEFVNLPEIHTEHHYHTDSVKERDSVHTENTTIIREVDSAAMAKYGIQMQANQRAWLVLQREMEQRLRELEHMTASRDTVRDSIPKPYPVEVKVPAELTWWQQAKMHIGAIALYLLALLVIILVAKRHLGKL